MAIRTVRDMSRNRALGWLGAAGIAVTYVSWSTMLAHDDVSRGRIWIAVPLVTALLSVVVRRLQLTDRPVGQDHRPLVGRP